MPRTRLPQGELRDEIRQPIYDNVDIVAAESPIGNRTFYTDVNGKDKSLTNLRNSNLLEATVSFRIMGIAIDSQNIYNANLQALALIQEHSAVRLRVGEKFYWEGNGTYVMGRVDAQFGGNLIATHQKLGTSAVQPVILTGKHVIDVPPLQTFEVTWGVSGMSAAEIALATPAANTKLRYLCSLKGLLRRPVQ